MKSKQNIKLDIMKLIFIGLWILTGLKLTGQTFTNEAPSNNIITNFTSTDLFGSSVSFYDFNGDGWDDLTFALENDSLQFYVNNQGTFEKIGSLVYGDGEVKHVLWADYDNDGHLDLLVTALNGPYRLFRNDGNFNFTDVSVSSGLNYSNSKTYGASFGDYNKDGYLDLYVCKYYGDFIENYHENTNQLYKNNGDGTFTNVTISAGVGDTIKPSFMGVWMDYDNDGWIDLYVINDRTPFSNSIYRNNHDGTFTNVVETAGIEMTFDNPMSLSFGDVDNDGDLDIYITNTGHSNQHAHLFLNNGDGTYTNEANEYSVDLDKWAWGAVWLDLDNDTWLDLYVATGNVNIFTPAGKNYFYKNSGIPGEPFIELDTIFSSSNVARSYAVARGDIDNDGYSDIVVHNASPDEPFLWKNSGGTNNYIKITPRGTKSNKFAISSWIKVYAGGNEYVQYTFCGENYLGQDSQHKIFGLGNYAEVDSVVIIYPSGHTDIYYDLAINTHHYLTEGETWSASISPSDSLIFCSNFDLELNVGQHYQILWNTGSTDSVIQINVSGIYFATLTNEFGVNYYSDTLVVQQIQTPQVGHSIQHLSCNDANDGSIELEVNQDPDHIVSYTINWENGESGNILNQLTPGSYTYYYSDENGCHDTSTIVILEPTEIDVQTLVNPEVNGEDGSLFLIINGGTPPYTTSLNGVVESPPFEKLEGGEYILLIEDINGCQFQDTITVASFLNLQYYEISNFIFYPNPLNTNVLCFDYPTDIGAFDIEIYSVTGVLVTKNKFTSSSAGTSKITVTFPSSGNYLIRVANSTVNHTYKLVVL